MTKVRYLYYLCRRSYAGNFEETCYSRYVLVEHLEHVVLEQIANVLADPNRILEEANHLNDTEFDTREITAINEELSQHRFHIEVHKRAIEASRPKEVNYIHLASILPEAAFRLKQWISEASEEDRELILRARQIQVAASRD